MEKELRDGPALSYWRRIMWQTRIKVLLVAFYGAGLMFLLMQILNVPALVLAPQEMRLELGIQPKSPVAADDFSVVLKRVHIAYPDAKISTVQVGSQQAIDLEASSYGSCRKGAIILVLSFRRTLSGILGLNGEMSSLVRDMGYSQCFNRGKRVTGGGGSALGPLYGAFLMSVGLLALMAASRRRPSLAGIWMNWVPRVRSLTSAWWGVVAAALILAAAFVVDWLGGLAGMEPYNESLAQSRQELIGFIPLAILAVPFAEEYIFRAWLLERGRRAIGDLPMLVASSAAFAAMHFPQQVMHAALLLVYGVGLGLLWLRTRSLLACFVAHAALNTIALGAMWFELV